jgi:glycosyltransferase involved in cell wall biosynthesis
MPKEIVFIAGKDPLTHMGGHSAYVRAHARAAIAAGFEVHFFCVAPKGGTVSSELGTVHKIRTPLRSFRQTTVPIHVPMIASAVRRFLLQKKGPHLIHSFGSWGCAAVDVARRLGRQGREVVAVTNAYTTKRSEAVGKLAGANLAGDWRHRLELRAGLAWIKLTVEPFERRGYLGSRLVLVNYDSVQKLLCRQFGDGMNIIKVPYTSESAFLPQFAEISHPLPEPLAALRPATSPLIVSVSRHDPRKGVDVLIRALGELKTAGIPFRGCLVGGGSLLARHRRLAQSLGLQDSTAITGWVDDPTDYLSRADIFVLPSLEEGSGSVSLIEAMQARLPVVASNIDGIPEDVTDGENGLLVPPGDVSALRRAIERLLHDAGLRERLSRASRETFERRFSAEPFVAAMRGIYSELGF